jgi:flagellar biosynthesis protein FlhB
VAGDERPEAEDRTEAPTQRRLDRARADGQVPLSREALGFAGLLAATIAMLLALPHLTERWVYLLRALLLAPDTGTGRHAAEHLLLGTARDILPLLALIGLAGVLASLAQTGPLFRPEALLPDPGRLDPRRALGRIFGWAGLGDLLKAISKLGLLAMALWWAMDPLILQAALHLSPGAMLGVLGREVIRLLAATLLIYALISIADVALVRWRFLRNLRMSRQDLREEAREAEGDPQIKARLRRLRESRARQRMMAAVPKAAVVITNPTHYAVALAYERGQSSAPRLVAKGADAVAARIREVATAHGVPVVSNPPLARALFRLEPDTELPAEYWQAVAEIIAFVWGLRPHG